MNKVLLVEDKASVRGMLCRVLAKASYQVDEAETGQVALYRLGQSRYDLVLTDLMLPDLSGLDVLRGVQSAHAGVTPVIVMTGFGTVETAVEAMKCGAYDFIQKPVDLEHLLLICARALEHRQLASENLVLKEEVAARLGLPVIIGEHESMVEVGRQIQRVASTHATVLLLGESGTGKELFAKRIHNLSSRKDAPFVTVNCAALPEALIENELFGHEKGSFTGAHDRHIGKFELAHHGSIFLDEVGELPLSMQAKVLRVLEERKVDRLGGGAPLDVDVRIITATNRDLRRAVERKEFREDLYFRLSVFPIILPLLRQRVSDIPALVRHFLKRFGDELNKRGVDITPEALQVLQEYAWPGNVRELRNCIERAIIVCDDRLIRPQDLHLSRPPETLTFADEDPSLSVQLDFAGTLKDVTERAVAQIERLKIRNALRAAGGNKAKAAERLEISYKTLLGKLREWQT